MWSHTTCKVGISIAATDASSARKHIDTHQKTSALCVGVLSVPLYASTNDTIQTFSDVSYETCDYQNGTNSMREIRSFRITHNLILTVT